MGELKQSIVVDLAGNLTRRAKQYTRAMKKFGADSTRSMRGLRGTVSKVDGQFFGLGKRLAAVATAAAVVRAAKKSFDLEEQFTRLAVQANVSDDVINKVKSSIFNIANDPNIRVDPQQIFGAMNEIIEKTGDLDFAANNIRNLAIAIQATGAQGDAIGGITAEFQKMGLIDPKGVMEALDILNTQGKEGAFTLQNLAALGPKVVSAYTAKGRGGIQGLRELGATLQVIRQGTGSSEQAATAFEALLAVFSETEKLKILQKNGIQIFDLDQLKKGKEVLRPINELMIEILKASGGKATNLSTVFDREALRSFNAINSEFQRTGGFASLEKFLNVQTTGGATERDAARIAKTSNAKLTSISTSITEKTDSIFSDFVDRSDVFVEDIKRDGFWSAFFRDIGRDIGVVKPPEQEALPNSRETFYPGVGKVTITVKSDKPASITKKSGSLKNVDVNVESGLNMQGQ